jgi:phage tail-like protein
VARYGIGYYGATKYGAFVARAFSVEPMSVLETDLSTVSSFSKVLVKWQTPRGNFTRIRLVRNQGGFSETSEDGIIIFDEFATEGTVSRAEYIDGEDNPTDAPLVPGRQVYYRMFLFTEEKIWKIAGSVTAVVPSDHGIQNMFMSNLPRVFTSIEQGSFGTIDSNSYLYNFMSGLTFSLEQLYTLIDLLKPRHTGLETPIELLPIEVASLGLTPEAGLPTKNRKRLVREANYLYARKGTKLALETYAESLTGFEPTITVSENLLLTVQDSTFYGGTGNWVASNAVLTSSTEQVPDSNTNQIDTTKTGKIVASNSGSMVLGATNIITKGVPVLPSTAYVVSCKLKSPASAGNITLSVRFYDKDGTATSAANTATAVAANNTWKSASKTATSDATSSYAIITIAYSAAGTYYIDQVCMQKGSTVAYDEARAIDVFLSSLKTNYIKNPSFEVNSTTWALSGATFTQDSSVPTYGYSGDYSGKFVVTNPWSITTDYEIPVTPGKYYTASASIKALAALSANIKITFYDEADGIVETITQAISVTTSFANVTLTGLTDSTSDAAYAKVSFYGTTAGSIFLDLIQFEQSQVATDYFDGSLPSDFGAVWEGTDDASYSHLYPSKPKKIPRLAKTLIDWVPQNSFWRLRTYDGVEYTTTTV